MKHIQDYVLYLGEYRSDNYLNKNVQRMKSIFADIDEDNFKDYSVDDIKNILLDNINTYSQLYQVTSEFRQYCLWCVENKGCDDNILYVLDEINLSDLWRNELSKLERIRKRFITYDEYEELIADIEHEDEYNALYYITLIMSIYEGVWDINWDTARNIRARDVDEKHHRVHIVRPNQDFWLDISPELTENLIALAKINYWRRDNRSGVCDIVTEGQDYDSVFKAETRKGSQGKIDTQVFSRRLNKITNDYLGYPLKAQNIYLSGIIQRIKENAEAEDIKLQNVWEYHTKNTQYKAIIQEELDRIGYNVTYYSFRTMVQGIVNYFY